VGELDLSTISKTEGPLFEQLRAPAGVIVDLTGLSFIDSSGIGVLIQAFRASSNGTRMHIVVARDSQVDRVFRISGVDRVVPLFFDRGDALVALSRAEDAHRGDQLS